MRIAPVALLAVLLAGCGGSGAPAGPVERPPAAWRTWVLPSASAVAVQRAATPARRGRAVGASAVGPWIERTIELGSLRAKDPPGAARSLALVSVAMHDAVVAAAHGGRATREGAAAGAAARVLAGLFPDYPAARLDALAARTGDDAGVALGRAVGDSVLAHARSDGFDRRWEGRRPRGPAHWEPPPGSTALPVRPTAGACKTWVLPSGRALRPPAPPEYGSAAFRAEAREVLAVGRRLTPAQKRLAAYWGADGRVPPAIWNEVALGYLREAGWGTARSARALALVNVALADAGVAAWDAKYAYWSPRPVNAIHDLGLDRRWRPLLPTPFFPSYVSGHATFSAAAAEVLAHLFPADGPRIRAKAREAAASRLHAGIHFRSDNDTGLRMGRRIGRLVVERARADERRA